MYPRVVLQAKMASLLKQHQDLAGQNPEHASGRPRKAVTVKVERNKRLQEVREAKMSETLPGFSGGQMPGRSKVEG